MISATKSEVLQLFSQGRNLYRKCDFINALSFFNAACDLDPEDGPSQVFCERCKLFLVDPPPGDWDGVFEMKTK